MPNFVLILRFKHFSFLTYNKNILSGDIVLGYNQVCSQSCHFFNPLTCLDQLREANIPINENLFDRQNDAVNAHAKYMSDVKENHTPIYL